jgi:hypothetical protein
MHRENRNGASGLLLATALSAFVALPGVVGAASLRIVLDEDGAPVNTREVDEGIGVVPIVVRLEREPDEVGVCLVTGVLESYLPPSSGHGFATPGEDYVPLEETFELFLGFSDMVVEETFEIVIIDDGIAEPNERINLRVVPSPDSDCDGPTLVDDGEGTIVIIDNDASTAALTIVMPTVTVPNGTTSVPVEVVLDPGNVQFPIEVSLDLSTRDGSAVAGTDYQSVNVNRVFTASELSHTVNVPLEANPDATSPRQFFVDLSLVHALFPPEAGTFDVQIEPAFAAITIDHAVAPPPDGLVQLTGAPGTTVSHQLAITGNFPMALSAEHGSVTPSMLSAPGNVTYSRAIPSDAAIESVLTDTITLDEEETGPRAIAVQIEVVAPADRNVASIAILTPNQRALAEWVDDACPAPAGGGAGEGGGER